MLRSAVLAAFMIAISSASAEPQRPVEGARPAQENAALRPSRDRFVVSGDECGASSYQHLLGREYAQVHEAALLPADAIVQNRHMVRTLEYTPHKLNVVVGGGGRIIAIGCF